MKKHSTKLIGVLALLVSSVSSAAGVVTVVPSNATPLVAQQFTVTLLASLFTEQVGGATMTLAFNPAVVSYVSGALPAAGPFAPATGTILQVNQPTINILPGTQTPNGSFDVAVFTFLAVGNGAANIVFSDDGGVLTGWFDATTADPISVSYNNANVIVGPPPVVPVPAAAWLLISALGSMVVLKRRAQ